MHLSIQYDCRENSIYPLSDLGIDGESTHGQDELTCWSLSFGDSESFSTDYKSFSFLLGKRLLTPLLKEQSGCWGFSIIPPKKYVEFIIGSKDCGEELVGSTDPSNYSEYFTQIQFRKSVLDKYIQLPSKYRVEDSMLWCGTLWSIQMDNQHDDWVFSWLGDLGRDLPYTEQLYWRSHNVIKSEDMSSTYVNRQINCSFEDSNHPDILFQDEYKALSDLSFMKLGWHIILPLSEEDEHYLKGIRALVHDEQKHFDEPLAKVLNLDNFGQKALV